MLDANRRIETDPNQFLGHGTTNQDHQIGNPGGRKSTRRSVHNACRQNNDKVGSRWKAIIQEPKTGPNKSTYRVVHK